MFSYFSSCSSYPYSPFLTLSWGITSLLAFLARLLRSLFFALAGETSYLPERFFFFQATSHAPLSFSLVLQSHEKKTPFFLLCVVCASVRWIWLCFLILKLVCGGRTRESKKQGEKYLKMVRQAHTNKIYVWGITLCKKVSRLWINAGWSFSLIL